MITVENLKMYFYKGGGFLSKKQTIKAVDDISFTIRTGETLGLVGESGCGKSTTGRAVLRLYTPTDGKIIFDGQDITKLSDKAMLPYRKSMQMIFQDPYASLNSRMTISDIISEALIIHNIGTPAERRDRVKSLLERVGLKQEHASRYPHEFSGGQRQRIGIARALAVKPKFIICDEPISALDVSIQAQVINMLEELQEEFKLTYLFIAHDLSMVKHISTKIGVMYLGKMVEIGDSEDVYANSQHPYTQALLSAVPIPDPTREKNRIVLEGDVPSPIDPPPGCRFATRCKYCKDICKIEEPTMKDVGGEHFLACHL